jgi:hypothetical protein
MAPPTQNQQNLQNNDEDSRKQFDFGNGPAGEVQKGFVNRMKSNYESRSESRNENWSVSQQIQGFEAESLECEAQRLKEEAKRQLECTEEEFRRAQCAQEEAARAAELANQITLQALSKEVEGQEKLVQAGHKLMEAGAKLQSEAAKIGHDRQAIINTHQKGQIKQETRVEVPPIPPPSELNVLQNRQIGACIPVNITEQQTYQAGMQYQQGQQFQQQQQGPQMSF